MEQKCFQLLRFSFFRVRVVRAHALRYERKSAIEPERRNILNDEDLFLTVLVKAWWKGWERFLYGLRMGIVDLIALSIIFIKVE